jgi:hypothetical protein
MNPSQLQMLAMALTRSTGSLRLARVQRASTHHHPCSDQHLPAVGRYRSPGTYRRTLRGALD